MSSDTWSKFTSELSKSKNIVSLKQLAQLIKTHTNYNLSYKEKEFIYEVYKSNYDDKGKVIQK